MLLTLDLDRSLLIVSPGHQSPVTKLIVPNGAGQVLRVQLIRGGLPASVPGTFELAWTVKLPNDLAGDALAYADAFSLTNGVFSAPVNYRTEELDTALGSASFLALSAVLTFRDSDADEWQLAQNLDLTVQASVWQGVPGEPTPIPSSLDWLFASLVAGDNVTITQDPETGLITIAAEGEVPAERQVATTHSLQGGGDLTEDRTLSLVGDTENPGNNKVYGTNNEGERGWKDDPTGLTDEEVVRYDEAQELSASEKLQHAVNAGTLVNLRFPLTGVDEGLPSSGSFPHIHLHTNFAAHSIRLIFQRVDYQGSGPGWENSLQITFSMGSDVIAEFTGLFSPAQEGWYTVDMSVLISVLDREKQPVVDLTEWLVTGNDSMDGFTAQGVVLSVLGVWLDD